MAVYNHSLRDRPPLGQGENPGVVGIGILKQALTEHQLCARHSPSHWYTNILETLLLASRGLIGWGVQVTNGNKGPSICGGQALLEAL